MANQAIPRLLLTTGEPAGIGPELLVKIAQQKFAAQIVVVGNRALLQDCAADLNLPLHLRDFDAAAPRQAHQPGQLHLIDLALAAPVVSGQLNVANATFVLAQLDTANQLALRGEIDAVVTNPLQKSVINDAGIPFSGHTEFFAQHAGNVPVLMLLANDYLRVALATTHLPLRAVADAITPTVLSETLQILHNALQQQFGLPSPRITVLGLNPHAGESGHLGREEIDCISPTLETLRARGLSINGPVSADTAFTPDKRAQCDAYLAMYHDQGLPVLKALGFHRSVNITLGLPYIRTSVDHGTALDLAGKNRADTNSLMYAIETALQMIQQRNSYGT